MIPELVDKRATGSAPVGCWVDTGAMPGNLAGIVGGLGRTDWRITIVLAEDAMVARLNQEYRNTPGVTDVLSFSYLLDGGDGNPDLVAGEGAAAHDLWFADPGDEAGEIVLAPAFVACRCLREGWAVESEFALLVLHGCLHVLGWEHDRPRDRDAMRALETELLAGMGMKHPLA